MGQKIMVLEQKFKETEKIKVEYKILLAHQFSLT